MEIQAPHIANLFFYSSYVGIKEEELRKHLVDNSLDVCNPDNDITEEEFLKVLTESILITKDKYFGLHYGCFLNIKALGFISQLSLNASSIQQAVFILQSYFENSFPLISLASIEKNKTYTLEINCTVKDRNLRSQLLDIAFVFLFRELKLMVPDEFLPTLQMPYLNRNEYSNFLNADVEKGKGYFFIFDIRVKVAPINKKATGQIEILLPKFLQMLDKRKPGYKSFSQKVRSMVLNMCSPELPTFEQVAVQFPLSQRTIQRKLSAEGLSYRKIADDIKKELSNYLSKSNRIKTLDIAYILGYSESSAYLHAAKKWVS